MTHPTGSSFSVSCIGHEGQRSHTDYVFRVKHSNGTEWMVQRRYQELLDMHERLSAVFGTGMPEFPRRTAAANVVSALFGAPASCQPSVVADRERAFQRYFNDLCVLEEVTRTACFQSALGVRPPEPVSHLRVRSWLPGNVENQGFTVLLDIRPDDGTSALQQAVPESYNVVARLVFEDTSEEQLIPVAESRVPAQGSSCACAPVEGLKPGAQVELEVKAFNAVGQSTPVSIRLLVPASMDALPSSPLLSYRDPKVECKDDVDRAGARDERNCSGSGYAASFPSSPREAEELQRQRQDLERQREEQHLEAARLARLAAEAREAQQGLEQKVRELKNLEAQRQSPRKSQEHPQTAMGLEEEHRLQQQSEALLRAEAVLEQQREKLERQREEQQLEAARLAKLSAETQEAQHAMAQKTRQLQDSEDAKKPQQQTPAKLEAQEDATKYLMQEEHKLQQQADALLHAEAELKQRAERLAKTEKALLLERQELVRGRANLAVVQAHVVSMLDKNSSDPGVCEHRMDDEEEDGGGPDAEEVVSGQAREGPKGSDGKSVDRVWSMDWTSGFSTSPSSSPVTGHGIVAQLSSASAYVGGSSTDKGSCS